jgi:predicted nucleic acid binding AN1-type Zn finger protein
MKIEKKMEKKMMECLLANMKANIDSSLEEIKASLGQMEACLEKSEAWL